jgi:hypothetical protein
MKYYEVVSNNFCFYLKGRIYPENYKQLEYCNNIGLHAKHCPSDFKKVPAGNYFVQEGIMPRYFAIKKVEDNPFWEKYIDWLNNTYFHNLMGCIHEYYGFDDIVSIHPKLKYFKNNPVKLTLEQWDKIVNKTMKEEFKLPENWWIDVTDDNINILKKWWDCPSYNTSHIIGMVKWISSGQIRRGYNLKRVTKVEGSYDFGKEITIEQFIKYVLKQEVMEEKEIIGWKLKEDCEQYEDAVLTILEIDEFNPIFENCDLSVEWSIEKIKKAGVLELWFEPVYKEKTLQFGGYDVIFEKVTSGVRITCNGETGTFSQIEAIYNYFKPNSAYFKFGSQEVKSVTYMNGDSWNLDLEHINPIKIKIGCTAGTWKEFTDIYEKAKSML